MVMDGYSYKYISLNLMIIVIDGYGWLWMVMDGYGWL